MYKHVFSLTFMMLTVLQRRIACLVSIRNNVSSNVVHRTTKYLSCGSLSAEIDEVPNLFKDYI